MSDHGSGLQPIGGLVPIGGLAPIGGSGGGNSGSASTVTSAMPPSPIAASLNSVGGVSDNGRITPPTSLGNGGPTLRPAAPAAPANAAAYASPITSSAPSVYVPPRAADAPVWEDPTSINMGKVWAAIGYTVLAGLLIGAFFVFRTPPAASIPSGYTAFTSGDKLWGFDTPQNWSQTASGAASGDDKSLGMNGVVCTSGSAKVDVSMSTVAGLIKSQLLFGNDATPEAMGGSHANGIQESTLKDFKKTFRGYQEKEITENLPTAMGQSLLKGITISGVGVPDIKTAPDVRLAEYTASSNHWGIGGPVHGYRATLGGENLIAYVVCQSSERDWPTVKPAFLHMLASVHETPKALKSAGGLPSTGVGNLMSPIGGL